MTGVQGCLRPISHPTAESCDKTAQTRRKSQFEQFAPC